MQILFKDNFRRAVIALIITNMIWGAAPPIFKWALEDIGPFTLAFIRFFTAALILLPFAAKNLHIDRGDIKKLIFMALTGISVNISFFFIGLQNAPSINASLIAAAAPIFIIFGSFIFLKEGMSKKIIIGANIGLIGVLVILLSPLLRFGTNISSNLSFFGNVMYVFSMLGSLGTTLIGRRLMEKYEAAPITFWTFLIGAITFAPFCFNELALNNFQLHLTMKSEIGIVFGVLFSSALAYYLFFKALKHMQASQSSVFTYMDPVVTVAIAIPLLHEIPGFFFIVGGIFVFLGIYVAEGRIHYHPIHLLRKEQS